MSSALAIAGVTAVLQYYLNGVYGKAALAGTFGSAPTVSAIAPDLIQDDKTVQHQTQVNLFMHQVTHNSGWRNQYFPSMSTDGMSQLKNPPLALDLHYLLTAYGADDCEAEALLGYAVLMLHQSPVLTRTDISTAISAISAPTPPQPPPSNPMLKQLASVGLADQVEMIKITPATLGREEMAWIWTALKADYRLTYPFQVSVVLIDPQLNTTLALPVMRRKISTQAGLPPQLFELQPPKGQAAASQGNTITLTGQSLTGASLVALSNPRLGITYSPFPPATVTDTSVTFTVPNDVSGLPAGIYNVSLQFTNPSSMVLTTNALPMGVAPTVVTPIAKPVSNASGVLVTVSCIPNVLPTQSVSLAVGSIAAVAQTFNAPDSVSFQFPALPPGTYLVRLQVDGIDSPFSWTASPPSFTAPTMTI